ncbi:uncharacterized protein C5orf34 homolog isoform 3-T3 [Anableps anableps]
MRTSQWKYLTDTELSYSCHRVAVNSCWLKPRILTDILCSPRSESDREPGSLSVLIRSSWQPHWRSGISMPVDRISQKSSSLLRTGSIFTVLTPVLNGLSGPLTSLNLDLEARSWSGQRRAEPCWCCRPQPEQMYQSTTVIQHHSCFAVDSTWAYPLSLARHHWTSHLSNSNNTTPEEDSKSRQADEGMNISDKNHKDRDSQLPQALPLTCPSPHLHRWKIKDSLHADEVSALPTELVKILWCQGVTYRILSGEVPVVEVSLGDGSVIRSNGVLNSYFTHHKPKLQSEEGSEITYHLSSLPPGVPGQLYPVGSIVSRASRILVCYNQAKHLLKFPTTSTCLQQDKHISKTTLSEQNLSSEVFVEKLMKMPQTAGSLSDVVAAELEKIKRFNVLLENNHLLRSESEPRNSEGTSSKITQDESVHEDYIAEALQRTSETIKEIDALISATTLN